MKTRLFLICFTIIAALSIAIIGQSCNKDRLQQSVEDLDTVTVEQQLQPTIGEIIQLREEMKHTAYLDSIWLTMPEKLIVYVLMNKGTNVSQYEIVEEYLNNKQLYDPFLNSTESIKVNDDTITIIHNNKDTLRYENLF